MIGSTVGNDKWSWLLYLSLDDCSFVYIVDFEVENWFNVCISWVVFSSDNPLAEVDIWNPICSSLKFFFSVSGKTSVSSSATN